MRTYHILFREKNDKITSKGENFEAENPLVAYKQFEYKYSSSKYDKWEHPILTAQFVGMYDLEALGSLRLNPTTIQEQADIDDVLRMRKEYDDTEAKNVRDVIENDNRNNFDDPPF